MLNEALRRELLDLREEDRRVRNEEKANAGGKNGLPPKAGANRVGHVRTSCRPCTDIRYRLSRFCREPPGPAPLEAIVAVLHRPRTADASSAGLQSFILNLHDSHPSGI